MGAKGGQISAAARAVSRLDCGGCGAKEREKNMLDGRAAGATRLASKITEEKGLVLGGIALLLLGGLFLGGLFLLGGILGEGHSHGRESERHAEHQSHQFFHCAVLLGG